MQSMTQKLKRTKALIEKYPFCKEFQTELEKIEKSFQSPGTRVQTLCTKKMIKKTLSVRKGIEAIPRIKKSSTRIIGAFSD